jgi:hypothetical protein
MVVREDTVAVMEEESVPMVSRYRVAALLYGPLGCGMHRRMAMQNPARGVLYQHEDRDETKGRRDHRAESAGDDGIPLKYPLWFPPIIAAGRRDVQSGRIEFLRRTRVHEI